MRVVFSRKGFDSAAGGAPSPIVDGIPVSLPIPAADRSVTSYADLGLGSLVEQCTRGRITGSSLCHHDPMFENGRCAFGQTGAAQTHLANNGVGKGDVFLFFGLFADLESTNRHHRIFGYLRVDDVVNLGARSSAKFQPAGFSIRHPHTIGRWHENNTLYVGNGLNARNDSPALRLSVPDGPISRWCIPAWLRDTGLTYHADPRRWRADGTLDTVPRGQEFIADISTNPIAKDWVEESYFDASQLN